MNCVSTKPGQLQMREGQQKDISMPFVSFVSFVSFVLRGKAFVEGRQLNLVGCHLPHRLKRVLQQHGNCHGANSAGDGSDGGRYLRHGLVRHITH